MKIPTLESPVSRSVSRSVWTLALYLYSAPSSTRVTLDPASWPTLHQQLVNSTYRTMASEAALTNLPILTRELVTKLSTSSPDALG